MPENVIAEVILRSTDGSSILDADEPITSKNVDSYRVEKEVIERATKVLRDFGFEIVQTSETAVTISGDKERFEEVFDTTLELRSEEGPEQAYEVKELVRIPDELSSFVDDIAFPTPPEFH